MRGSDAIGLRDDKRMLAWRYDSFERPDAWQKLAITSRSTRMLDLTSRNDVWDESLRPIGDGDHDPESFATWWSRNGILLANLDAQIADQWVYRHWTTSPFRFVSLESLSWRRETWSTLQILGDVHLEFGGPLDAEHDYNVFQGRFGALQTARTWRNGSWNVPVIVLETPTGVRAHDGDLPAVRYVLVEGAKRLRFLNALNHRGEISGPHLIYILTIDQMFP